MQARARHVRGCWTCRTQNTAPDSLSPVEQAGRQAGRQGEQEAVGPGAEGRHSKGGGGPANHAWSLWSFWEAPPAGNKEKFLASLHLTFLCSKKIVIPTPLIGVE